MATTATEVESGIGGRTIESGRFERACTEAMAVTFTGPGIVEGDSSSGSTYEVELGGGVCECRDYEIRGERLICKHVQRAALAALYTDGQPVTEVVARVARYAREAGCQHEVAGCAGPTTTADRLGGLPCQQCIEAVRSPGVDEMTVWERLAGGAHAEVDGR